MLTAISTTKRNGKLGIRNFALSICEENNIGNFERNVLISLFIPFQDQVKKWSKDAYECMDYHQHDYEMYNRQPRAINSTTLPGSIMSPTKPTGQDLLHSIFFICAEMAY